MASVLLAEDDPNCAAFMTRALRARGWSVHVARDGRDTLKQVTQRTWDLVMLDLVMPGPDGLQVLSSILEAVPDQPVIIVSGRSDTVTKVAAFSAGAVDYICKPFAVAELVARAECRCRRAGSGDGRMLRRGKLLVDTGKRQASVDGKHVALTEREYVLLVHMMGTDALQTPVCTREELLSAVWGYSFDPGSNVVDVYIRRLRTKLGRNTIETVRNVGYSLAAG